MIYRRLMIFIFSVFSIIACKEKEQNYESITQNSTREASSDLSTKIPSNIETPDGMVWIPGGIFKQGAIDSDQMALNHEKPAHKVAIDGFFMDKTEITNARFQKFVNETGYVTVAEREINWDEMKKQLPPGTPKPHDSILQPGSLTFKKTKTSVPNLYD